jgi:hypothetical protein
MGNRMFVALLLSVLCLSPTSAQDSSDLEIVKDKVRHHLEFKMPGWKHKRGIPMLGSRDVIEDFWSVSNRVVKISILPHKSPEEAQEVLRRFVKYDRQKEELKGLGDEAYAWGYGLSNIVFSRGRFTVYVSTTANVDEDADARSLNQSQRGDREKSEMRRLSKEFAKHMANAIDLP